MFVEKTGTEVHITSPIKKSYQIESDDTSFSVELALDTAKNRYPNKDWSNPVYTTSPYKYEELVW